MIDSILHYLKPVRLYEVHFNYQDYTGRWFSAVNTYTPEMWKKLKPIYDSNNFNYAALELR